MKTHFQILIIGGGNAGISAASQLHIKNSKLEIAIIDPSEKHYYQPAWTLVGGGAFDINATVRSEASVMPKFVTWIQKSARTFEPTENQVTCTDGTKITYDYLIVAPGIQLDWYKIKGAKEWLGKNNITSNYHFELAPYTFEAAKSIKKGQKAIFTNPNTPIKCGGAPQKIMYLLSDYFRKNGILNDINVHFYSGGGVIFGVKKYADTLNKVVERYGIQTHFKHNCVEVDGANKIAYFEDEHGNRVAQEFDMIHLTPPQSAPDFIKKSPLAILDSSTQSNPCLGADHIPQNYLGWIDVHKHTLQHNRYANIFACGDAASTPNAKTGAAIRKQVPVLVENLLHLMNGGELSGSYNGYGSCPLVTGYGKLVLAEFDYDNNPTETFPFDQSKERWSMYQLKTKVLPWLYWNKILKGTA
jgi:sulfide:quinone oxidoreductase